jgi:Holliday junction resolvasome RuvABC endonuclease subunit
MRKVLALDLGTTTGWAIRDQCDLDSGFENFSLKRGEGGGMRFLRFKHWLEQLLDDSDLPDVVFYELVMAHKGADAAHIYGGLQAVLTTWCEENKVPYQGIGVGTVKKFWTGKGNANKEKMIAEANRRGFLVADDNEADAIAVLECGVAGLERAP